MSRSGLKNFRGRCAHMIGGDGKRFVFGRYGDGPAGQMVGLSEHYCRHTIYHHTVVAFGPLDKVAIETLDYPFDLVDDIIFDSNLKICLDLGHLILYGFDIKKVYEKYAFRTTIIPRSIE